MPSALSQTRDHLSFKNQVRGVFTHFAGHLVVFISHPCKFCSSVTMLAAKTFRFLIRP